MFVEVTYIRYEIVAKLSKLIQVTMHVSLDFFFTEDTLKIIRGLELVF